MATPFSGVGSPFQLLPEPVGAIGQLMPPGPASSFCSSGFFDGAAAGGHAAVIAAGRSRGWA